jgi:glycosyltransferase involved in cell wall biosynthesis
MLCSIVIPTIGRHTLKRAIESVLIQNLHLLDFEVIVVNDSGVPLPEAQWQRSERVQVINTNRRERSIARNTGAAIAKGQYLHFLDDDDWLSPDAYQHLWALSQSSNAKWLYGMTQLVDRQNNPLIQLRHGLRGNCFVQAMAGEWIPLQSSWIERETFMRLGGFNPLLTGPEDIDLLRRILLDENVDESSSQIASIGMGTEGSTTDYDHHPEASRWARENILDASDAYQRMNLSANDPFWRGRMVRIYLTSVVWNMQHLRLFTAFDRLYRSFISILISGRGMFKRDFWQAVLKPYASITFKSGFQQANKEKMI